MKEETAYDNLGNEWIAAFFDVGDFSMAYYHTVPSSALPALVFLHGLTCTGSQFIPLYSQLAGKFQVFLPSARGHGKSNPIPKDTFLMETLVEDTAKFIRHVSPEIPVFLIGWSLGAATAARTAQKYPEIVRKLVLEDPPWTRNAGEPFVLPPGYKDPSMLFQKARELQHMSKEEFEKIKFDPPFNFGPPSEGKDDGEGNPHATSGGDMSSPFAQTAAEDIRDLAADEIEPTFLQGAEKYIKEGVEGIQVPTLLLIGEPGLAHCLPHVAKQVLSTWPNSREVDFPGADHAIHKPPREQKFLETVRYFLSSDSGLL